MSVVQEILRESDIYLASMAASNFLSDGSSNAAGTYKPTNSGAFSITGLLQSRTRKFNPKYPNLADFNGDAA
jgi:hypothetical protein